MAEKPNPPISQSQVDWENVDRLFEDYRKSGLALMATIIGLSSGGFFGLFQIDMTRGISFLYLIPITIALMQQLTYYLGSKSRAGARREGHFEKFATYEENEWISSQQILSMISMRYADFYFDISDVFCATSAISLGLVTIWPMALFSTSLVGVIFSVSIGGCLTFWAWKRFQIYREIKNTVF
ncbi:MAG: hypothetical protein ACT4O3_09750 [Elusimicrobiota bacterium]